MNTSDKVIPRVVELARDLIRFNTTNYGLGKSRGEHLAADYVASVISSLGLQPQLFESEPNRVSVITRMQGSDPTLPALVVHGHLDVVPAAAEDWQVDPFAG